MKHYTNMSYHRPASAAFDGAGFYVGRTAGDDVGAGHPDQSCRRVDELDREQQPDLRDTNRICCIARACAQRSGTTRRHGHTRRHRAGSGNAFAGGWRVFVDTNGNGSSTPPSPFCAATNRSRRASSSATARRPPSVSRRGIPESGRRGRHQGVRQRRHGCRLRHFDPAQRHGRRRRRSRPHRALQLIMNRRAQTGSGLIESLISILVVSIGFLGFAGLQINGLAAANDSLFRSKAVYLSYQMADRVRANLPAATAGAYDNFTSQTPPVARLHRHGQLHAGANGEQRFRGVADRNPVGVGAAVGRRRHLPRQHARRRDTSMRPPCDGQGNVLSIKLWWTEKGQQHRFASTLRP